MQVNIVKKIFLLGPKSLLTRAARYKFAEIIHQSFKSRKPRYIFLVVPSMNHPYLIASKFVIIYFLVHVFLTRLNKKQISFMGEFILNLNKIAPSNSDQYVLFVNNNRKTLTSLLIRM